jgi:Glycosyl transferase family 2
MAQGVRGVTPAGATVDVNLFAFNAEATIGPAIESVLAQTWPAIRLTIIDNGSTDATLQIAAQYSQSVANLRVHRARANGGAVVNCQRAFSFGDADFVMPKTADDLLAPDFIEQAMAVLRQYPDCAMCHARGLIFTGNGAPTYAYPAEHSLLAVGADPMLRARHVMASYTSAPSFWGVYRRAAVDLLAPFRYRAGWDHFVLAELALHGEIRHVAERLYWRRDAGKPVAQIARGCTEAIQRGLPLNDAPAELRWMTPLITTAYSHIEGLAVARLPERDRIVLMTEARDIFRARWLPLLQAEARAFATALPELATRARTASAPLTHWMLQQIAHVTQAIAAMVPESAATG